MDAAHYLKEIGAISAYQLHKAHFNTWEDKVGIVVNREMFDKAQKQLNFIHKRMEAPQPTFQQIPVTDDTTWPDNFKWIDENMYDLAGEGRIVFMAKEDNKTKTYFKTMADAKTYVETRKMSKETGEDEAEVKIKLNQIREKIRNLGYHKLLAVEARNDRSQASAYRLVPYPTTIT